MSFPTTSIAIAAGLLLASQAAADNPLGAHSSLAVEHIGLHSAARFRQASGQCGDCPTSRQALWYFRNDILAVPAAADPALPGLVWLGSPLQVDEARIGLDGRVSTTDASSPLHLTRRLSTNRSWWDASTTRFYAQRPVRLRGSLGTDGNFVARTVWPRDFVLAPGAARPLGQGETLQTLVRGMGSTYDTRVLWQRQPGQSWAGKAAIGIMLNGAQGDDDEAHGGHFAIATGYVGKQGEWADWLVNNFYNIDSVSEKGIIAAPVPMDNYLMDVNSGQQFYRPSAMLVAVLKDPRTAAGYQARIGQAFERFYRHDFVYRHAAANCAGISIDAFRDLGWQVPARGPTSTVKAIGAYGYLAATELSLKSGRAIYDYLTEEQTRLYPAVAFDALGNDLLHLVGGQPGRAPSDFERQLMEDVEALVLVRIPQVPSSRAMGAPPVYSFDEFMRRAPADRADWKIVPVPPRPFPAELREPGSVAPQDPSPVPATVAGVAGMAASGMFGAGLLWRRRRRKA